MLSSVAYKSALTYRLQDGRLYGDGWTPLMAAAVADRHNIAVRLLTAAGTAVGSLVRHANRYGQTAVHIAARKGSLPMLTALLAVGGPAIASVSFLLYLCYCGVRAVGLSRMSTYRRNKLCLLFSLVTGIIPLESSSFP